MALTENENARLNALERLLARVRGGPSRLTTEELDQLPKLYRHASSIFARLESRGDDAASLERVRGLVGRAHAVLHRGLEGRGGALFGRLYRFFLHDCPRQIRREWRLLTLGLGLVYGLAAIAYFAVSKDLSLAFSLLDPEVVAGEISQLEATPEGEAFRGNFTFGIGESPGTAGMIMTHNMMVAVLFYAVGLLPPFLLTLLAVNALMLGTYTAVAGQWDQAGSISSILWCHGVLEIQALILAGTAGMVLLRAWVAPGAWSRVHAMRLERVRSWRLMAPVFPLLAIAGMIEGYISPHLGFGLRVGTAIVTGALLLAWVLLGGRGEPDSPERV